MTKIKLIDLLRGKEPLRDKKNNKLFTLQLSQYSYPLLPILTLSSYPQCCEDKGLQGTCLTCTEFRALSQRQMPLRNVGHSERSFGEEMTRSRKSGCRVQGSILGIICHATAALQELLKLQGMLPQST